MFVIWIYLKYNSRLSRIWIIIYITNITRYKVRVQNFLCGTNHCDKLLSNIRWNERNILIVFDGVVIQDILWNREQFSVQCDKYPLLVCYFSSQNPIQKTVTCTCARTRKYYTFGSRPIGSLVFAKGISFPSCLIEFQKCYRLPASIFFLKTIKFKATKTLWNQF